MPIYTKLKQRLEDKGLDSTVSGQIAWLVCSWIIAFFIINFELI